MPNVRDLIAVLRQRPGVDAAIVLGRDGLVIDGQGSADVDAEDLAALVPNVIAAADELGTTSGSGVLRTAILEYPGGVATVFVLSGDAVLLVLTQATADVGALLYELRRHREQMAALV